MKEELNEEASWRFLRVSKDSRKRKLLTAMIISRPARRRMEPQNEEAMPFRSPF
jgi:hypothetical protein